ncbi:hypothetical protein PR048_018744 [Dryococelus australis]|uniref:Uncharacterized protein n=1 Tax=Dryococelus australis TaxID=614101 RepID=A0ABQ9HD57_9NEOP|nr:hypothetical protein PR048_018744 [Dryococelus australis]
MSLPVHSCWEVVIEHHLANVLLDCECGQCAYSKKTITRLQKIDHSEAIPVLGCSWGSGADTFSVNAGMSEIEPRPLTKRKILSSAHKLFDPTGATVPVVLIPKLLIQ